jgi:hypothetical protein
MTEDHKSQIHPIVLRASELASKGIDPVEFDNYAVEQLQNMLREYFGKQDLVQAVEELITFAFFLDTEKGCHSASMQIIKVANSATEGLEALINGEENTSKE